MARPSGCSLRDSAPAAREKSPSPSRPGMTLFTARTRSSPRVSVPVLSKHSFFTPARRSSASPSRTRKPVLRRVAYGGHDGRRRREHERAGAEDDEYRPRRRIISPVKAQVSAAAESAITTIQVAQRSARPTIFAFPASALCTRRIIRCMELSSADARRAHIEEPKRFTVPELTSSPADLSTGRLSPVMTLWSTEVSPEMTTPSHRYRLAGQDAEYVALAHVPRRR